MPITDSQWKTITERAFPLLAQQGISAAMDALEAAKAEEKTKLAELRTARDAWEDASDDAALKDAFTAAEAAWRTAAAAVETAAQAVDKAGSVQGQIESVFRQHWDQLADEASLDAWLDAQEISETEKQLDAAEAKLAEQRQALEDRKAGN